MPNPLASDLDHALNHTRDLWEEMRGQRVFITGGTGFFGSWLLESFAWANRKLNLGATAFVLTRNPDAMHTATPHLFVEPGIEACAGDITSFIPPKGDFTHVIHAASAGSADPAQGALDVFHTTVRGTACLLEAATRWRTKKILFTSSGAIYGPQPSHLSKVPENFLGGPDPSSRTAAYSESKRAAETLCAIRGSTGGTEIKIARCFAFVGPYLPLDGRFAIGNFIRDEIAGRPVRVRGDGTDVRSYLYAADLAIWLWTILFKGRSCDPYNVGSEQAVSIAATARTVAEVGGHGAVVEIEGGRDGCAASSRYVPSTRKARRELHLEEYVNLREAIRRTIEWHVGYGRAAKVEMPPTHAA
jgi:dTDP-glucose 4,6-dehydratase